jgi:hypothetical protein
MGILIRVDGIPAQRRLIPMLAIRITGDQLRAGGALAGLSMEDLALQDIAVSNLPLPCADWLVVTRVQD